MKAARLNQNSDSGDISLPQAIPFRLHVVLWAIVLIKILKTAALAKTLTIQTEYPLSFYCELYEAKFTISDIAIYDSAGIINQTTTQ